MKASSELTEDNLKKIFDEMGTHTNPDTFLVSSKSLKQLIALGAVRYDRVKCSWELLEEAIGVSSKDKQTKERGASKRATTEEGKY